MTAKRFCIYWLPVIVCAAIITGFSTDAFSGEQTGRFFEPLVRFFWPTISQPMLDLLHHVVRKGAHVTEYLILSLVLFRALHAGQETRWRPAWFWVCLLFVVCWAALDEFHQSFVPSRTASPKDVGFDSFGGLMGQLVCWMRSRAPSRKA